MTFSWEFHKCKTYTFKVDEATPPIVRLLVIVVVVG